MTNLKIAVVVLLTLSAYTVVANMIPQIESEVPEELELGGEVTPEQLVAAGERTFNGAGGCTACHGLGTRAPNLISSEGGAGPIGARCADREPGVDCKTYLYESLTDPGAYIVEGYNPIMPDVTRTLSGNQVWALVAFLQAQGGQVTVTADDLPAAGSGEGGAAGDGGAPAPAAGGGANVPSTDDPVEMMNQLGCFACHVLGEQGNALGPELTDVGARRDADYIRRSILEPASDTTAGFEHLAGTMPPNFGDRLTAAQLEALVEYLAGRTGDGGGS